MRHTFCKYLDEPTGHLGDDECTVVLTTTGRHRTAVVRVPARRHRDGPTRHLVHTAVWVIWTHTNYALNSFLYYTVSVT